MKPIPQDRIQVLYESDWVEDTKTMLTIVKYRLAVVLNHGFSMTTQVSVYAEQMSNKGGRKK